jgi:DDB1- and CUL4-associated factor 11
VRVYEPDRGWALRKDVHARNLRWTVTDTDISPDERFLIYSSITPDVHLVCFKNLLVIAFEAA